MNNIINTNHLKNLLKSKELQNFTQEELKDELNFLKENLETQKNIPSNEEIISELEKEIKNVSRFIK